MANALYPKFKQSLLSGANDLTSVNIKVRLLTSAYTYSSSHEFLSDTTGAVTGGTSGNLTSKTVSSGVFDADDVTFTAPTAAQSVASYIIYIDTGTGSTSRLIGYFDTETGLPLTTNGNDIPLTWDNGANKIFAL